MTGLTRNELNFSGGPGALPLPVLAAIQSAIQEVPETGLSILGISHRSEWFAGVVREIEIRTRRLLGIGDDYHVLLLQGGATQQFSMVPMHLLRGKPQGADYIHSGYWSGKALPEASREGTLHTIWDGRVCGFSRLPDATEPRYNPDAAYLHYVSNETVEGLQFHDIPGLDKVPRICDMSSDFLSRPIDAEKFSLIYAHAQKNLGPAGVTLVVIRDCLIENAADPSLPGFLSYREHIRSHSNYNTPPVFAIYVVLLILRWLEDTVGGLEVMARINRQKAACIYEVLDHYPDFYQGRARRQDRSLMNIVFTLPDPETEEAFLIAAAAKGFSGLRGHRAIGGIRASLYNGLTLEAAEQLADFMKDFRHKPSP